MCECEECQVLDSTQTSVHDKSNWSEPETQLATLKKLVARCVCTTDYPFICCHRCAFASKLVPQLHQGTGLPQ